MLAKPCILRQVSTWVGILGNSFWNHISTVHIKVKMLVNKESQYYQSLKFSIIIIIFLEFNTFLRSKWVSWALRIQQWSYVFMQPACYLGHTNKQTKDKKEYPRNWALWQMTVSRRVYYYSNVITWNSPKTQHYLTMDCFEML